MTQEQEDPTVEDFKKWMLESFHKPPRKREFNMTVYKNEWLRIAQESFGLTEEEALSKIEEAGSNESNTLLYSFFDKTTVSTINIHLLK